MFIEHMITKLFMLDRKYLSSIVSAFNEEYFESVEARKLYSIVSKHFIEYKNIPSREIILNELNQERDERFRDNVKLFIKDIDSLNFESTDYDYYFDETNKYLKERALKNAIVKSVGIIEENKDFGIIAELVKSALAKDLKMDLGLDYFGTLKERLEKIFTSTELRIPTYFPILDEFMNGGIPSMSLSVILGMMHGGKSLTLSNMILRQVVQGHDIALFTLEMSEQAYAQRFDSGFSGLDINKMYSSDRLKRDLVTRLADIKSKNPGKLYIKQFATGTATVQDFRSYLRELELKGIKPNIVYCDYLGLMKSISNQDNLYTKGKGIAEELRALAFEFDIPIVTVSQLNREGCILSFKDSGWKYIAESAAIMATADFAMILGKDEDELLYKSELHYRIEKNRFGGRVGELGKFYVDTRALKMYDQTELDLWLQDAKISGDERDVFEKNRH